MRVPCSQLSSLPQHRLFKSRPACEREFLRASIHEKGVLVPVITDEKRAILDGHQRLELSLELGIKDIPVEIVHGLTEEQKRDLILQLGSLHRSLTLSDRKELARNELIHRKGNISDNALGLLVGLSDKTVKAVRKPLIDSSEIPNLALRLDKNGISQPARKSCLRNAPSLDEAKAKIEARDKGEEDERKKTDDQIRANCAEAAGLDKLIKLDGDDDLGNDLGFSKEDAEEIAEDEVELAWPDARKEARGKRIQSPNNPHERPTFTLTDPARKSIVVEDYCLRLHTALSGIFLYSNAQKPRENAVSWAIMATSEAR